MKLLTMMIAMFFALSLSTAPAMADSKSKDRYSDHGSKDKKSKDDRSKDKRHGDDRSKAKKYENDREHDRRVENERREARERNRVETRDVRRDNQNRPIDNNAPRWWPFGN